MLFLERISRLFGAAPASQTEIVPPEGGSAWLTSFTSGVMTFLAVFALALSMAAGRLADRWSQSLENTATVRLSAPPDQMAAQIAAVLGVLESTPGIASARALSAEEQGALLAPWFGPDLPVADLPLPSLIEVQEDGAGYDSEGLRLRLQAEAPGAVLDDHAKWRRPLAIAAERLRLLGFLSLGLIALATATMVTLAANAALAANHGVIRVLRLVGAKDKYIAKAFTRRFTQRSFWGAILGMTFGLIGISVLPNTETAGSFLTGLGFSGMGWALPLVLPPVVAFVAFVATQNAALRKLKEMT